MEEDKIIVKDTDEDGGMAFLLNFLLKGGANNDEERNERALLQYLGRYSL